MKLARLVLPVLAVSLLAACATDSPTAPALPEAPPSRNEGGDCAVKVAEVQSDGTIIWRCPGQTGSGG